MNVLFVHLLNNYTGSPQVLRNVLLSINDCETVSLLTSNTNGCLSDIENVDYHWNGYRWISNKFILAILLLFSHIKQFFSVLLGKRYDCVYINTILPFGAALAAHLRKEKVIYHIHEYYEHPGLMQKVCIHYAKKCANQVIFVSNYLCDCYKNTFICPTSVVHNTVSNSFHKNALLKIYQDNYVQNKFNNKLVVLPCGLKKYKGIFLFLELARRCPNYKFLLVTSNSKSESDKLFNASNIPSNFEVRNQIKDMGKIYEEASLVVNLSIPHGDSIWIETFGMTLIESFEYLTPVLAPCYGGPLEVVKNDVNGFLLEVEDIDRVNDKINVLLSDFGAYKKFCENTKISKEEFNPLVFGEQIKDIINSF